MRKGKRTVDKVRASRDGHEFHETWAARKALQLLMPRDGLIGIAVEGLSSGDEGSPSQASEEIADLVLYYGRAAQFAESDQVVVLQFKYSIRNRQTPFRMSDAKSTIEKFVASLTDHRSRFGFGATNKKIEFALITNRPIDTALIAALQSIRDGKRVTGTAKVQRMQLESACGLKSKELQNFAKKLTFYGNSDGLFDQHVALSRTVVAWSASSDAIAQARLGRLRKLVRDKAGSAGEGDNLIRRTDVLAALDVQGLEDLFPCPNSFPEVGKIVPREQLAELVKLVPRLNRPLLIHAAGGVGKTVVLQSLAAALSKEHCLVLFDCFGGGAYRAPEDARHLPKRGLIHIVNTLACQGLCDPLLPSSGSVEGLIYAARARFCQVVETLRQRKRQSQLLIFLDAIDNAAQHALDKREPCFPKLLLESIQYKGQISGVQLIATCRTHRREISKGDVSCEEFQLRPFSETETNLYLRARVPELTVVQQSVAYARSGGNPRVLEHLALSDRGLLESSEATKKLEVEELIKKRIADALREASKQGYGHAKIAEFLAGLAVLPPPVPVAEYAAAYKMDPSAIESFATDLAPLLERTNFGVIFRDEPTETLVRDSYSSDMPTLKRVATNLLDEQSSSLYAATALPVLLQKLDDEEGLFKLAFDERLPKSVTSTIGKQAIRYARLKAAVLCAARKRDFDRLVSLLVELSTLAGANERGSEYILENPDLVVASKEVDALRRLFEIRTAWQGTRHARLVIANVLSQQRAEASRHARMVDEWISHYYRQSDEARRDVGPNRQDIAALVLCLLAEQRYRQAVAYLSLWKPWYAFEVCQHLHSLLNQLHIPDSEVSDYQQELEKTLRSEIGPLAAAIAFGQNRKKQYKEVVLRKLAKACKAKGVVEVDTSFYWGERCTIRHGLLKASAQAIGMRHYRDAIKILKVIQVDRPKLWTYNDRYVDRDVFVFVCHTVIASVAQRRPLKTRCFLPQELVEIANSISSKVEGQDFQKALKEELELRWKADRGQDKKQGAITYETKADAEDFISGYLDGLFDLSRKFSCVITARSSRVDQAFSEFVAAWVHERKDRGYYRGGRRGEYFFELLGRKLGSFALWVRDDLCRNSIETFLKCVSESERINASVLIDLVEVLAHRPQLGELVGGTANRAKQLIETENDVSTRASLFARLARAVLPASADESTTYFRTGLEQIDAVGSGDYEWTHEMLGFTASLKGSEIESQATQTLTNICEMNMPDEPEKFGWSVFGAALSKASGFRGLAKLGRWDDRSKVALNVTLLPYLVAMIEQDKIAPEIALGLLRLCGSVELYECDTTTLAKAIHEKQYSNAKELIKELVRQFQENDPGIWSSRTFAELSRIVGECFGPNAKETIALSITAQRFARSNDERNDSANYNSRNVAQIAKLNRRTTPKGSLNPRRALSNIKKVDESSILRALDSSRSFKPGQNLDGQVLAKIREKLKFSERVSYVETIAKIGNLSFQTKLDELAKCKELWSPSSVSIDQALERLGPTLVQLHSDDFLWNGRFSGYHLRQVEELCRMPRITVILELIQLFAAPDKHVSAGVWMALSSTANKEAPEGTGQRALTRLLSSKAAKLASSVADGEWRKGLDVEGSAAQVAAGLVWAKLGSPAAADRWRAAHSIRAFARLGQWDVIDALVSSLDRTDSSPFQAPEVRFLYLDARLWLTIGLARLALDSPREIERYSEVLLRIVFDADRPHVLLRHFAAQALLACAQKGHGILTASQLDEIRAINASPFPQVVRIDGHRFRGSLDDSGPYSSHEFHLDYDFEKGKVHRLGVVFGKATQEVSASIRNFAKQIDPAAKSMYDDGGRARSAHRMGRMSDDYHSYGQQLGWNGLYVAAGEFLSKYPVTDDSYDENPWPDWLTDELLTRDDGLWLADGVDPTPSGSQLNLLERGEKELEITGERKKLLLALGIDESMGADLVVEGSWTSPDGIRVRVSSALVKLEDASRLATDLLREEPFRVWLPTRHDGFDEQSSSKKSKYEEWVVSTSREGRLDGQDPLGSSVAVTRSHFTDEIATRWLMSKSDAFGREWHLPDGKLVARTEAWGRGSAYEDRDRSSGQRMFCSTEFLRRLLKETCRQLLLLIKLERYEKESSNRLGQFSHTIAVVTINEALKLRFYRGAVNKVHKNAF